MAIELKNSSNTPVYEFPSGCELIMEPWSKRQDTEPRAYQHGGVKIGDEKVGTRVISLHGIFNVDGVNATYGATLAANLKEMKKQCYTEDLRLYPGSQYTDEYYNVECLNFESEFLGMITIVEINIDFICSDPFRYYKDETTDPPLTVDKLSETFVVNNTGDIEVFPVITFTVGVGASIPKITITNITDAGKSFEYTPADDLIETNVVEVDCQNGTVELNTGAGLADDIANWSGRFIRLLSGNNSITITVTPTVGTNQCVFAFRKRWL